MRRTVLVGLVIAAASRAAIAGPPVAEVSPGALSFPAVHAEHGSATLTLEITNAAAEGDDELVYSIAPHAIGDPVAFTVTTSGCPLFASCASLPGWTDTYTIAFHPQNNAVHDQPLVISTNDPDHPTIDVPLIAQGDYPRLVIDEIGGEIPVGQVWTMPATPVGHTTTATLTGRNASLVELHLWSTYAPFGGGVEIAGGPTGERWLAPGEVVTWTIACTPPSVQGAFQTISFDTNGNVNPSSLYAWCPGLGAELHADPTVEFGVVAVGQEAYRRVRVTNAGNQVTTLDDVRSEDPRFAALGVSLPSTLEPGAALEFDLRFTPTESGPRSTTVTLDAGSGPDVEIAVHGQGAWFGATLTPSAHDFGVVAYPARPVQSFQLTNTGEGPLEVTALGLDAPSDFVLSGLAVGDAIAPGASHTFEVRAKPIALGHRRGHFFLSFAHTAFTAPLHALSTEPTLQVVTVDAAPDDYALDLGDLDVDDGPVTRKIELRNLRFTPIQLFGCGASGPGIWVATPCPVTIPAGGSAVVEIAFDPAFEGTYASQFWASASDLALGSIEVELRGRGINQHVAIWPTVVEFPETLRHPAVPAVRDVTIINTGATVLDLSEIVVEGDGFSRVGTGGAMLAPGATLVIQVAFAPRVVGDAVGWLVLANAEDPSIARVQLVGRGIDRHIAIAPAAVNLGAVEIGHTVQLSDLLPSGIAIANTDVDATIEVTKIAVAPEGAFVVPPPVETVLAPGKATSFDVMFTPTTIGAQSATIEIFFDGAPEPYARVAVSGRGLDRHESGCSASGGAGGLGTLGFVLAAMVAGRPQRRRRR